MLPRKKKLMQRLMISLMIFIACITLIALYSRHTIDQRGQRLLSIIQNNHYPAEQAGEAMLLLNQAENDFQLAVLSYNARQLGIYKEHLHQAFVKIDSIRIQKADSTLLPDSRQVKTQWLYQQKMTVSDRIFELKKSFDSVILLADKFTARDAQATLFNSIERLAKQRAAAQQQVVDTVKPAPVVETRKRGFFKKLKDVFSSKQDTLHKNGTTVINNTIEKTYHDTLHHTEIKVVTADVFYQQLLGTLRKRQKQLNVNQANMFIINQHMMGELKQLVTSLQSYSHTLSAQLTASALGEYQSAHTLLNTLSIISLLLILAFSLLVIIYINKIKVVEKQLAAEYEVATNLAQQKTDLLATMSHEIRNPLNAIIGFLNAFKQSGLSSKQAEMMEAVQLSSDMLLGTVNDVLDMSKLESGQFQLQSSRFNPFNTLRQTVESVRFNAQNKQLALTYAFEGNREQVITGDTFRLNQLVLNLLSNAIKYTAQGSVHVQAQLRHENGEQLLSVTVTDTGVGMSKAQQAGLFTRYYQASPADAQTGTGLGLYICYKLVQIQQGTIQVNSTSGKGTAIQFTIPYAPAPVKTIGADGSLVVDTSVFNGKRILVADDNELNLKLVSIMTRNWEARVSLATNGKEAFDLLLKEGADLVLTDMEMAEMNGKELVTAIRKSRFANIPVVLSSAYSYDRSEIAALQQAGFTDILAKPFNEMQLAQKLFAALQATAGA